MATTLSVMLTLPVEPSRSVAVIVAVTAPVVLPRVPSMIPPPVTTSLCASISPGAVNSKPRVEGLNVAE